MFRIWIDYSQSVVRTQVKPQGKTDDDDPASLRGGLSVQLLIHSLGSVNQPSNHMVGSEKINWC